MGKTLVLRLLGWLGLLKPAYRAYERVRALPARPRSNASPGGAPLPPAWLRVRVAGTPDSTWFLESGRRSEESIREALAAAEARLEDFGAILDFGCGCGRVIRYFSRLPGAIHGSDADASAIRWCRANLPFADFHLNTMAATLPYEAASFDFVYALSVFTHLQVDQQHAWMRELTRIVRPGGFLLVTTHGNRYLDRLTERERTAFCRGEVVVRRDQAAGTNLCTAFQPARHVRESLARGLDVVHEVGAEASPDYAQDVFLLRRPAG